MSMDIDATQSLQFDLPIVPRSGSRSIPADELIRRLEILAKELQGLDQETVDKHSLSSYSKDLVDSRLLNHSNKTVKALTACCLSDMLRLYAPEAPYTRPELKSIFSLFLSQLKQLESSRDPNFASHFYLLENLSTVKSIIIISDFDNAEEMATEFFACCFNVVSKEPQRNVQVCMTELLAQIVEEVGPISQESIELLLEQFEKTNDKDPCYMMALDLCRACTDALQRRVCQYFSDVLVSMSRSEGSAEDEEELIKLHHLIQRVHSVIPDLLLNVLPQLEEEMKVDNFNVRLLATETIGSMFAEEGTALFHQYPGIWKTWLGRRNDKTVQIRVQWLQKCGAIYQRHSQVVPELNDCIRDKISDPEEKVRATACQVIGGMDLHDILYSVDKTVLEQVSLRCRDKKQLVRKEAMTALGAIYNSAFPRIYEGDDVVINKLGWIPDTLFNCMYLDDLYVMSALESTVNTFIFPENLDDASRTERLVTIHGSLQQRSRVAFSAYLRRHKSFVQLLSKYIQTCFTEDEMTDMEAELNAQHKAEAIIKHISSRFPDGAKTASALRRLREAQNVDTLQLLKTCIDPEAEYDIIVNARKQFERSVQDLMPGVHETFDGVLNRACLFILNKTCVPHLFQILQNANLQRNTRKGESAQELLKEISACFPTMYQSYAHQVVSTLLSESDPNIVNGSLELLANISTTNARFELFDNEMLNQMCNFIRVGTVEQARYTAAIISNTDASDLHADIIETACRDLKVEDPHLVVKLTCLAEFALYKPAELSNQIVPLLDFIKGTVMEQKTPPDENQEAEWLEYDILPDSSKQKLAALQVLVNYLLSTTNEEHPDMLPDRVFALLWECLDFSCDVAVTNNTSTAETSHLRLAAAQSIVKLTHLERYGHELTVAKFERLGLTVQDSCYYVRAGFAETLMKGLQLNQIHPRYFAFLFLYAHEPESDLIKQIKNYIKRRAIAEKGHSTIMETSFVVLIHILAHHPDFTVANDDLLLFVQYFEFYLSCIATPDNVSFLYHVAQKIKSSKDMVSPEQSQNSYILCDMASYLIKKRCEEASWPLNVYPQRINLQSKLYKALPAGEIQHRNLMNNFLPSTFMKLLTEKK